MCLVHTGVEELQKSFLWAQKKNRCVAIAYVTRRQGVSHPKLDGLRIERQCTGNVQNISIMSVQSGKKEITGMKGAEILTSESVTWQDSTLSLEGLIVL